MNKLSIIRLVLAALLRRATKLEIYNSVIVGWNLTNVNFTPMNSSAPLGYTSPLLATGTNANLIDPFFTANTTTTSGAGASTYFIGARRLINDNGWNLTSGWVNWQPEILAYTNDGNY